jgi:hypothetical protein
MASKKTTTPPRPPTGPVDFLEFVLPAGAEIVRCGETRYPGDEFYYSSGARFSPFRAKGRPQATLYAATTEQGALSETVFHDISPKTGGVVDYARLGGVSKFTLCTTSDLVLADFTAIGLKRIRQERSEMIDSYPTAYPMTQRWARKVYTSESRWQGITWMSRQDDTSRALVLFGSRVPPGTVQVTDPADGIPLNGARIFTAIEGLATKLDILIINTP